MQLRLLTFSVPSFVFYVPFFSDRHNDSHVAAQLQRIGKSQTNKQGKPSSTEPSSVSFSACSIQYKQDCSKASRKDRGRDDLFIIDRDSSSMVDNQIKSSKFSEPRINISFQSLFLLCVLPYSVIALSAFMISIRENRMTQLEVMKSFFPRLIDICRGQRKALSYKPVDNLG